MYNEQVRRGQVSEKAKFEYAWCLVRSKYIDDMKEGVALLEGTDKRCPIYQYCVLHHSLQISYSSLYHLHCMYHMPWTILFHFFTSSDLLLYGKVCIACFRVTVLDPHIQKTSKFMEYKNFKCKIYLFLPWMSYGFGCITHKSWLFHLHVKRKSLMWQQLWKTFFFLMTTSNTSIPWMIGSLLNSMVI